MTKICPRCSTKDVDARYRCLECGERLVELKPLVDIRKNIR